MTRATSAGAPDANVIHVYNANDKLDVDDDGTGCGDVFELNGDLCEYLEGATPVVFDRQKTRIVVDELLDGTTLEEFFCACAYDLPNHEGKGCAGGVVASQDPVECPDDPGTPADESGRWLDADGDTIPDAARLLDGLVSFFCDGATTPTYVTGPADGFYQPSGNQLVPVSIRAGQGGLGGLGPAIVLSNLTLPAASQDCRIELKSSITDKDGNSIPNLANTVTFNTEAFRLISSKTLMVTVPTQPPPPAPMVAQPPIKLVFNGKPDVATLTGIKLQKGGVDVVAPVTLDTTVAAKTTVLVSPAALLTKGASDYTITIPTTVTEQYQVGLDAETVINITTAP